MHQYSVDDCFCWVVMPISGELGYPTGQVQRVMNAALELESASGLG